MMQSDFLRVLSVVACASVLLNCGSGDTNGEEPAKTEETKQGFVECGEVTCNPGQHCDNLICLDGCQSNVNCASDQACEDIDGTTHVGTCRNGSGPPPSKDCETFCAKAEACNAPNIEQCAQICEAASTECVACVNDSNCGSGCESVCGG